jgi:hypothetical protein
MNADYLLSLLADSLRRSGVDAILIGNAAAALRGAPVTTLDFDFLIRTGPETSLAIKRMASALGASIIPPRRYSTTVRLHNTDLGLDVDLLARMAGIDSFDELAQCATVIDDFGAPLQVASLADVIRSKEAAGRPKDLAVLPTLRRTLRHEIRENTRRRPVRVRSQRRTGR